MLIQPASREYRTWLLDTRRWQHYHPRAGDVIVASYPKTGTTWTQRIVDLLLHQDTELRPLDRIYPWVDRRFPMPAKELFDDLDRQSHRRALKSHAPLDGLTLYEEVYYLHVGRDGRDVCLSYHNHITGFAQQTLAALDREGMADHLIRRPYPRVASDPAEFFKMWLTEGVIPGQTDGSPFVSFFELERSYWEQRRRPNVLFVHYRDLSTDLANEIRRIAQFLRVNVPDERWPDLLSAASFVSMRRDGAGLMPDVLQMFSKGAEGFFHRGENERWRGVLTEADLETYAAKLQQMLPPACADWVQHGRCGDDPRLQ